MPVWQSITTQEPDSSPSRRAAKLCRPASMVVRKGGPETSERIDRSRSGMLRAVTSVRTAPGRPRSRGSITRSSPSLPILKPGASSSGRSRSGARSYSSRLGET